jgi:hypothetical protein
MRCPSCNHDSPADASFCEECDLWLVKTCPQISCDCDSVRAMCARIEFDFRSQTFFATTKEPTEFLNEAPAMCTALLAVTAKSHQLSVHHFVQENHS